MVVVVRRRRRGLGERLGGIGGERGRVRSVVVCICDEVVFVNFKGLRKGKHLLNLAYVAFVCLDTVMGVEIPELDCHVVGCREEST